VSEELVLTGRDLTLTSLIDVARYGRKVRIAAEAERCLAKARKIISELMDAGTLIYGGNTGVGWSKDVVVSEEFVGEFNRNLLHSHAVGVPPYASAEETRAVLLIRLNTSLTGHTGLSPAIPAMLSEFLNRNILPLIPERGSVGQTDIGCLAHVGLAMIGEGDVIYRGQNTPARKAMEREGLVPLELGVKDGLAIMSSNALGSSQSAIALDGALDLLAAAEVIYCLSLEGFNGNVSPLDIKAHEARGFAASAESASRMGEYLSGSYLYRPPEGRALQDPLCFRNGPYLFGAAFSAVENAGSALSVHFNHSDDNPCLLADERRVISCSNFDPLPWVLELEMVSLALSHVSKSCCLRCVKLASPAFTGLSRNLAPNGQTLAFSTIQKTFTSLDAEIRLFAAPVSMDTFSLAGDNEDMSSNAPLAAQKLRKIVDNLRYIVAIELILACQAMDLRENPAMGHGTRQIFKALRATVPFYARDDHAITGDINAAYELLKRGISSAFTREAESSYKRRRA
jgi:histidine ammonia-lyase